MSSLCCSRSVVHVREPCYARIGGLFVNFDSRSTRLSIGAKSYHGTLKIVAMQHLRLTAQNLEGSATMSLAN